MFLDDELKQIYEENGFSEETSSKLFAACVRRLPEPNTTNPVDFFNEVKKIDGGWKLFCQKHKEYNADGFRNLVIKMSNPTQAVLNYLGWNR